MKTRKISKDLTIKAGLTQVVVYSKKQKRDIASLFYVKPKDMDFTIAFLTFLYLGTEF